MTDNKKQILGKLIEIQSKLDVPKDIYNKFGDFYYRSIDSILSKLKPLLKDNGLVLTLRDTVQNIGERFYVVAIATLSDGEETIECSAYAREALVKTKMDDAQITGSASSYARKYALSGMFLLDDSKDIDSLDNSQKIVKTANKIKEKVMVNAEDAGLVQAALDVSPDNGYVKDVGTKLKQYGNLTDPQRQAIKKIINMEWVKENKDNEV